MGYEWDTLPTHIPVGKPAPKPDWLEPNYIGMKLHPVKPEAPKAEPKPAERKRAGRRTPATLAALASKCPSAAIIWIALVDLSKARKSAIVTPTRAELCEATGINRLPTISKGLTTLEECGWIDRIHVPVSVGGMQTATVLRVVLRRERKAFHTNTSFVENGKRSKGRERKAFQDFPKGKSASARPLEAGRQSAEYGEDQKPNGAA